MIIFFVYIQIGKELPILKEVFRPGNTERLTLKRLMCLLKPSFSEPQTNSRKYEGEVYTLLKEYFKEAASK